MDSGFIRFELADGELVELDDDDLGSVYRELWRHKAQNSAMSTATLLSHEIQLPQEARRTIELTQAEGEALWDAIAEQRVVARH